jgi:hypothetical protein
LSPLTEKRSQAGLAVTLAPGWRRLHTLALMEDLLGGRSSNAISEEYGPGAAEQLHELLTIVAQAYLEGNVLLTAVRIRAVENALDVLTLAVPHAANAAEYEDTNARSAPRATGDVEIDGASARLVIPQDESPADGDPFASRAQVIALLPSTRRGAILTLLSTAAGAERMLEDEAARVASSLRLEGDETQLGDLGLASPPVDTCDG